MTKLAATAANNVSAFDIARDTIKRMATERIPPTPENYQLIYNELANIPAQKSLDSILKALLKDMPADGTESLKWVGALKKLVHESNPAAFAALVKTTIDAKSVQSKLWPSSIRDLVVQWEKKQRNISAAYKKETLERVLISFGNDPTLPDKLLALTRSWAEQDKGSAAEAVEALNNQPEQQATELMQMSASNEAFPAQESNLQETLRALQGLLMQALNYGLIPRLEGHVDLKDNAKQLLGRVDKINKIADWQLFSKELKDLLVKVESVNHDEDDMKTSLLGLLRLLVDNIGELVDDDKSVSGQVAALTTILSSPLEKSMIKDIEKSLKEVIYKQGALKHSLTGAKENFKQMVAVFIERLGALSDTTSSFHGKIESYAEKLEKMDDITQINALVESLAMDTRVMQTDILRSHKVIDEQRAIALASEEKIRELEIELNQLSEKVRVDQLTGVLNRRGLDESFVQEVARAQRGESHLCVAMLDIDNFKQLNDNYGHEAGDDALKMLAELVKSTVRPNDVVARFGGEEFIILLPGANIEQADMVITRLQRQLTKKFFMQKNERVLITFSAGIALYQQAEEQSTVIHRADSAMYLAKKMGKNRVMTENDL